MKLYQLTYKTPQGTFSLWSITQTQAELWRQTLVRQEIIEDRTTSRITVHTIGRNKAAIAAILNEYATGASHTP